MPAFVNGSPVPSISRLGGGKLCEGVHVIGERPAGYSQQSGGEGMGQAH